MHSLEKNNTNNQKNESETGDNSFYCTQNCYLCGKPTDFRRLIGWVIIHICPDHSEKEIINFLQH